jgi:NCAIR mutase (PurE)-related protein
MEEAELRKVLTALQQNEIDLTQAIQKIEGSSFEAVGNFARLDLDRATRTGFPEVIFGQGKTAEQVAVLMTRLMEHSDCGMATRVDPRMAAEVQATVPGLIYHPQARILYFEKQKPELQPGIAVVTAGTSDIPVAEEAALTAELMGHSVARFYDVGVAGLHRLLAVVPQLQQANVVIVVAGMEGALASVVAGLLACPILAVPTSVGYGASFGGITALLAMINSCAGGVSVVNIDNGFGAGVIAARINQRIQTGPAQTGPAHE